AELAVVVHLGLLPAGTPVPRRRVATAPGDGAPGPSWMSGRSAHRVATPGSTRRRRVDRASHAATIPLANRRQSYHGYHAEGGGRRPALDGPRVPGNVRRMPEGHTVRRLADRHWKLFGGRRVAASSPQGRFADGAALISGQVLESTDAY